MEKFGLKMTTPERNSSTLTGWQLASSTAQYMHQEDIKGAEELAGRMGKEIHSMTLAYAATTVLGGKHMAINADMSPVEREVTIYHELAHELLYQTRGRYPTLEERSKDEVTCETFGNLMIVLGAQTKSLNREYFHRLE